MAVTKDEVKQGLRQLEQVVDEATEGDAAPLAEIQSVLRQASEAVRAIQARPTSGAYVVSISPERMREYFPVTEWPPRDPTPDEMAAANARWEAALERGRQHRKEALEQLGPVLTPRQVAERLGVSTVTVNNWRRRGKLLGIRFDNHQYLYPLFQFAESPAGGGRGVLRHFDEVLSLLPGTSSWSKAQFFVAKAPALGGRTPLEVLRGSGKAEMERLRRFAPHAGEMGT